MSGEGKVVCLFNAHVLMNSHVYCPPDMYRSTNMYCSTNPVLLTWSVLIIHQLENSVLQLDVRVVYHAHDELPVSFFSNATRGAGKRGLHCQQLQHVDGARPVTGPVGLPDSLRLEADQVEKEEAETLLQKTG